MDSPNTARPRASLWTRLVDAFHGRDDTAAQAPAVRHNSLPWGINPDTETWWHLPPGSPAGFQEIQACAPPDDYNFARLVWQACEECRLGLIAKIRVTEEWQRHGYGTRMVRFALRGHDGYRWTTTPQSEEGRAFFPGLAQSTGVAFPRQAQRCEHMRVRAPRHSLPKRRLDSPPR